jgi:hypothetical protein
MVWVQQRGRGDAREGEKWGLEEGSKVGAHKKKALPND